MGIDTADVFWMSWVGVITKQKSWTETHVDKKNKSLTKHQPAARIDPIRLLRLTVLIDEHAEWDAVGVEAVEEILDIAADEGVKAKPLLVLYDTLSHSGNHIVVTVADLN